MLVVTRAGRLREWSQRELRLYFRIQVFLKVIFILFFSYFTRTIEGFIVKNGNTLHFISHPNKQKKQKTNK